MPDLAGHGATLFVSGAGYGSACGVPTSSAARWGVVAATFRRDHHQRTLSLALVDAAGVTSPRRSAAEQMLDQGEPNPFLMDDPAMFPPFYAMTMARPPVVPGFVKHAMAAEYVTRRDGLEEVWGDWNARDVAAAEVWGDGLPDVRRVTYDGWATCRWWRSPAAAPPTTGPSWTTSGPLALSVRRRWPT